MKYEMIIGLEVHLQSKTESKMFCGCSAKYFGAKPNTHTCPVCLGLPGAMPVPNKKAVGLCLKLGLALDCKIRTESKFDRKNYFYPDLPKGYQISQYDQPFAENGFLEIETSEGTKKIGITRVHQEEDTGKSMHNKNETLLDYNKSGVPLIEVVTEPDFRSAEEVGIFAKAMKQIVKYADISDADMEKGQMRFEPNMSVREVGEPELPEYKVEVKNIGSISVLEKVIRLEFERQTAILEKGELPAQETRGLVDMSGKTVSQRGKETEADYRYFPEPDIPVMKFEQKYLDELEAELPEMPREKYGRFVGMGIKKEDAAVLSADKDVAEIFENVLPYLKEESEITAQGAANHFINKKLDDHYKTAEKIAEKIKEEYVKKETDTDVLSEAIQKALSTNEKALADYKSGKNPNAIMFLVGQVMREMKGQADANTVREALKKELKK